LTEVFRRGIIGKGISTRIEELIMKQFLSRTAKHTPGPWSYSSDYAEYGAIAKTGDDVEYVYGNGSTGRPYSKIPLSEQDANAWLVAKAPEMRALLREIYMEFGTYKWNPGEKTLPAELTNKVKEFLCGQKPSGKPLDVLETMTLSDVVSSEPITGEADA